MPSLRRRLHPTKFETSYCGDGVVSSEEECDDQNANNNDFCLNDCLLPICGDGILSGAEECDNGVNNSNALADACRTDCTVARCGDGVIDAGESCDDGNQNDSDSCPDGVNGHCLLMMCKDVLAYNPSATGGYYIIYPNGNSQQPVNAYCDMQTSGGGWTAVINPLDYQQSYLNQFPSQFNSIINYQVTNSPAVGVSWGTTTTAALWSERPYRIELNLNYDEVMTYWLLQHSHRWTW